MRGWDLSSYSIHTRSHTHLPGGVHHDDIELRCLIETLPVVCGHVGMDRDAVRWYLRRI